MAWSSVRAASVDSVSPVRRRSRRRLRPQVVDGVARRIVAVTSVRTGATTVFTATSTLTGRPIYHWYVDGAPVKSGEDNTFTLVLAAGEQVRIEVLDTLVGSFDALANAPAGYPGRRTLVWHRTLDATIVAYRVEQQRAGGAWDVIATVTPSGVQWSFELLTEPLDDLTDYAWRIVQMDTNGNDAVTLSLGTERIVKTPDAPEFTAVFDSVTKKVTLDLV